MKDIRIYKKPSGEEPFKEWIESFKDKVTKARIIRRIDRFKLGNEGEIRSVGNGVFELKFKFGAGYRIYYGKLDEAIVILLCGGDKGSQKKDIKKAHEYWEIIKKEGKDGE